jgi:decaprenylphospho-beta-D-erythro-pentofuranosid-2-ulose 2-reductase
MIDALGAPQSALLLGGTSEIGLAVLRRLAGRRLRRVVLAGRDPDALAGAASGLNAAGVPDVSVLPFDALDRAAHESLVEQAFGDGDIDLVVAAWGVLGDQARQLVERDAAIEAFEVNATAAVSLLIPVVERLREQGHGRVVVLSSVAAERPRRSIVVYGAAKAAVDAFAVGLGDSLAVAGAGVGVMVVRPGFVRTAMTAGLRPAPFAVTADDVAAAVVRGLERGAAIVWVPSAMRWVMVVLRHLPHAVFRRLPI